MIASAAPLASARELRERFARAIVGDEKAHLHFVGEEQLPADLVTRDPSGEPSSEPPSSTAT